MVQVLQPAASEEAPQLDRTLVTGQAKVEVEDEVAAGGRDLYTRLSQRVMDAIAALQLS